MHQSITEDPEFNNPNCAFRPVAALETYSSTTSRSRPLPRGESIGGKLSMHGSETGIIPLRDEIACFGRLLEQGFCNGTPDSCPSSQQTSLQGHDEDTRTIKPPDKDWIFFPAKHQVRHLSARSFKGFFPVVTMVTLSSNTCRRKKGSALRTLICLHYYSFASHNPYKHELVWKGLGRSCICSFCWCSSELEISQAFLVSEHVWLCPLSTFHFPHWQCHSRTSALLEDCFSWWSGVWHLYPLLNWGDLWAEWMDGRLNSNSGSELLACASSRVFLDFQWSGREFEWFKLGDASVYAFRDFMSDASVFGVGLSNFGGLFYVKEMRWFWLNVVITLYFLNLKYSVCLNAS